jgi:response regulator of citrate/malate metabolism
MRRLKKTYPFKKVSLHSIFIKVIKMNNYATRIKDFITEQESGTVLTQTEISKAVGISKPTVGKYLPLLFAYNEINDIVELKKAGGITILIRK